MERVGLGTEIEEISVRAVAGRHCVNPAHSTETINVAGGYFFSS